MFLYMLLALVLGAACGRLSVPKRRLIRLALACAVVFSSFSAAADACDTVVQRERVAVRYQQPERIVVREVVDDCPVQRERVILRQESSYDRPAVILRQSAGYGYQRFAIVLQQNTGYGREAVILRQRQNHQAAVVLQLNASHQRQGLLDRLRSGNRRGQTEVIRERTIQQSTY